MNDYKKDTSIKEKLLANNRDTIYITKTDTVSDIKSYREPDSDTELKSLIKTNDSLWSELNKIQKRKDVRFKKGRDTIYIFKTITDSILSDK